MKSSLFIILFLFGVLVSANAQSSETITELTPVPANIGKFSKRLPKNGYRSSNETLKFAVKIEFVKLPNDKNGVAVVVQTKYDELVFFNKGGQYEATIKVYERITSEDQKIDGFFEGSLSHIAEVEELVNSKGKFLTFRKVFELPEGKYQVGIIVRDAVSEDRGVKVLKLQVPNIPK